MVAFLQRACLALLLALAAGSSIGAPDGDGVAVAPPASWILPSEPVPGGDARYRAFPLVLLARDTQIRLDGAATERYEYHAYRINHASALTGAGTVAIPFAPAFQTVVVHFTRIRRDDRVIDLSHIAFRLINQENGFGQSVLTGNGTAVAQVPDLRVGDVLEYAFTVKGNNPVFGDRASFMVAWNTLLPMAKRRVRFVAAGERFDLRVVSPRGPEPIEVRRVQTSLGHEILAEGRDVSVARIEPGMPPTLSPLVMMAVTPYASWQEVSRWADGLFRAGNAPTRSYGELMNRLKKMTPRRAAVAEAVRFVQDDIRYFSVAIGENSHRPYSPSEVVERRYGDCKDKSLLLSSLLRGLGVDARPALTSTLRKGGIARFPPMPNVFDHAITYFRLDGRDYWIDPTRSSSGASFEKQGVAFAGSKALLVGSDTAALSDIPEDGANSMEIVEVADVRGLDEPVAFRIETRLSGASAEAGRKIEAQRGAEASERAYLDIMSRRYSEVKAAARPQVRDEEGVLTIDESYEIGKFFRNEGLDKRVAPLGARQLLAMLGATGQRDRLYPFAIPAGRGTFRYRAAVSFPPTVEGHEDPLSNVVSDDHFRLTFARSFRGNSMQFTAELVVLKNEVAAADFPAFMDKAKHAWDTMFDVVLLSSENLMTGASSAPPERLAEKKRREHRNLVDDLTRAINSGKLAEADLAEAHLKRGTAYTALRDERLAMSDLNVSLRLRPGNGEVLSARSLLHIRAGRLRAAEDDVTQALMLGAEPAGAYVRRGQIRFLAGRYADALSDFEQAQRGNTYGVNRDFIDIWRILAMRGAGRDPKPVFQPRLAADDKRRWPMPVLSFLLGQSSRTDVLSAAESPAPDERDSNLCEARYYIAQHQLLTGDAPAAIGNLRGTLATGIEWFQEYDLAQAALVLMQQEPKP